MPNPFNDISTELNTHKTGKAHRLDITGSGDPLTSMNMTHKWHDSLTPLYLTVFYRPNGKIKVKISWAGYGPLSIKECKEFKKALNELIDLSKKIRNKIPAAQDDDPTED